jgi:hypothetical protein
MKLSAQCYLQEDSNQNSQPYLVATCSRSDVRAIRVLGLLTKVGFLNPGVSGEISGSALHHNSAGL